MCLKWHSGKDSTCQCRKPKKHGFIPVTGRSPGVGKGNLLQYSCLENSMDRGAWRAAIHRVAKSWTQLKRLSMYTCPPFENLIFVLNGTCTHTHTHEFI